MGTVIGELLPLATGIAISPFPIIAAILMLLSPRAKATSVGFLVGWIVGILVIVVVFTLLSALIPASDPSASKPVAGVIKIVLGVLLLVLGLRQWQKRPKGDDTPALPKWMSAIDTMTAARGFVLGLLLSGPNPKNLLLGASAGLAIGVADLSGGAIVVVTIVFVVIAASTVAIPVLAYLVARTRVAGPLEALRSWLVANNTVVMSILLLVIGVVVIGKGIGSF
jgi:threonine/homoserine/homoserine lactone efflux protein